MSFLSFVNWDKFPNNFFDDINNLKYFICYVALSENYNEINDWYKCNNDFLWEYGFDNKLSISELLNKIYEKEYFIEEKFSILTTKYRKCFFRSCDKEANSNYEGGKSKYCVKHKEKDMVDVKNKKCEFEGCKTRPSYNYEGEEKPRFCSTHKEKDMINIKAKKCEFEGCNKQPNYNYEGEEKPRFCSTHKEKDMVDVKNKKCEFEGCNKQPNYNYEGEENGRFCSTHKEKDMIDVKNKKCEFEGCNKQPNYNYEGEENGRFCSTHKEKDMIDVVSKRCKTPLCSTHVMNKYEGYCLFCYINTFPDKPISRNYKTKEKAISDFILENFQVYTIITDKKIQGGCSKRRPDILIDLGHRVIIIEIDENQHINYDCSCENKRIMELYQDVDFRPIVFIRFNPDDYNNEKGEDIKSCWSPNKKGILQINKNKEKEWNDRLETLKDQVNYWIENESDKAIEVIQLYYDSDNP